MTLVCGLDFTILVLGPAAECCEQGSKPWVLQNPRNHTPVSRNRFLISVSCVLNFHLITRQIHICIKTTQYDQTARIAISNVSNLPLTTPSLSIEHLLLQNFNLPNCCGRLLKQVRERCSHSVPWSIMVDLRITDLQLSTYSSYFSSSTPNSLPFISRALIQINTVTKLSDRVQSIFYCSRQQI